MDTSVVVNEVLNETNSILYDLFLEEPASSTASRETMAALVSTSTSETSTSKSEYVSKHPSDPSNSDIMNLLLNISQIMSFREEA